MFLASFLAVSAFAQKTETEGELFAQISKLTQTKKVEDEDKAYALGKTFIERFGAGNGDDVKKVREFMNNYQVAFVVKRINEGKAKEAFAFGKDALAQSPDNAQLSMTLANAGYEALVNKKDKSFGQDSVLFAKQTIKLFEENKLPASFQPFLDRDEATAMMYYIIGNFSFDSNLSESAHNYYKAVQYTSKVKNNSLPYSIIAFYYEKEFEKALKEFQTKYGDNPPATAEAKAAEARLEKLIYGAQDAYARAIKLGEAENAPKVGEWKKRYNQLYEFIKGSSTGSAEYLANILTKPMPDPNAP
jgi:hypothetical protein